MEFFEVTTVRYGRVLARAHTLDDAELKAESVVEKSGYAEIWHRGHERTVLVQVLDLDDRSTQVQALTRKPPR